MPSVTIKPRLVTKTRRKRWNPKTHLARIQKILAGKIFPGMAWQLAEDGNDRKL